MPQPNPQEECQHEYQLVSTGGQHFNAGEYWDDIEESIRCTICGKEQPTEEQESVK